MVTVEPESVTLAGGMLVQFQERVEGSRVTAYQTESERAAGASAARVAVRTGAPVAGSVATVAEVGVMTTGSGVPGRMTERVWESSGER